MHTRKSTHSGPTSVRQPQVGLISLFLAWIEACFTTCRAYCGAAVAYEELYRLSARELEPQGYGRPTLARDVTGFDVTQHART